MSIAAAWRSPAGWWPALVALLAYGLALCGDFVYDDIHSVAANPALRELRNLPAFFADPDLFSGIAGNRMYRPVLLTTFALDHALGGGAVWMFKASNVLVHALTACLLAWLLRRWGTRPGPAILLGCVFAAHPLASEAVNLVSGRSESLLVLALLLGLHLHRTALAGGRAGALATCFLPMAAVMACGSKETGVVLPGLLLVQEWLGRGRLAAAGWRTAACRVLPAMLVVIGYLLLRQALFGQATATLTGRSGADMLSGHGRDLPTQLCTMATLLPRVLGQVLLPLGLSLDPPVVFHRGPDANVVAGILGLLATTLCGIVAGRRQPAALLGTALASAVSLPWIVIPLNIPLSEHRLYGLLAGVLVALAPLLERAARHCREWAPGRVLAPWAMSGTLLAFAVLAGSRSLAYRDEVGLWQAVVQAAPGNARAHWCLGMTHHRRQDSALAAWHLGRAQALHPTLRGARLPWAEALLELPEERQAPFLALAVLAPLRQERPRDPYVRILEANAHLQAGRQDGEREHFALAEELALQCLQLGSPKALPFRVAAEARKALADLPGAVAHLDRCLALGLDLPAVRCERAELLLALGRREAAERDLQRAVALDPLDPQVQDLLGRLRASPPR